MRIPRKGERGFTLIELLIVVAILGVLAAVVIPNVGRFLGRGEAEARRTEFHNVSSAVIALMTDNNLSLIPNAIEWADVNPTAVNDMTAWPDTSSVAGSADKLADPGSGTTYVDGVDPLGDKDGYLLYGHDITGGDDQAALVNYVSMTETTFYYTCETDGTVRQWLSADTTDATGTEYTY